MAGLIDIFGLRVRFLAFSSSWSLEHFPACKLNKNETRWIGPRGEEKRCFHSRGLWGWKRLAHYLLHFAHNGQWGEREMALGFKIHPQVYSYENPLTRCRHIHTHAELLVLSSLVIVVAFNKSCSVSGKHWQDRGVVSCICWYISQSLSSPTATIT